MRFNDFSSNSFWGFQSMVSGITIAEKVARLGTARSIIWLRKTGRYYIFLVAQGRIEAGKIRSKHFEWCLSLRASGSRNGGHMQLRRLVPVFLQQSLLLVFCLALNGCQSHQGNSGPAIELTQIPQASQGGRATVGTIAGRVRNAQPN